MWCVLLMQLLLLLMLLLLLPLLPLPGLSCGCEDGQVQTCCLAHCLAV